jgi:hypothetical protein
LPDSILPLPPRNANENSEVTQLADHHIAGAVAAFTPPNSARSRISARPGIGLPRRLADGDALALLAAKLSPPLFFGRAHVLTPQSFISKAVHGS